MSCDLVYMSGMIPGTTFCPVKKKRNDQTIFFYESTLEKVKMAKNHILRKSIVISPYQILLISCIEAYMNYISAESVSLSSQLMTSMICTVKS